MLHQRKLLHFGGAGKLAAVTLHDRVARVHQRVLEQLRLRPARRAHRRRRRDVRQLRVLVIGLGLRTLARHGTLAQGHRHALLLLRHHAKRLLRWLLSVRQLALTGDSGSGRSRAIGAHEEAVGQARAQLAVSGARRLALTNPRKTYAPTVTIDTINFDTVPSY